PDIAERQLLAFGEPGVSLFDSRVGVFKDRERQQDIRYLAHGRIVDDVAPLLLRAEGGRPDLCPRCARWQATGAARWNATIDRVKIEWDRDADAAYISLIPDQERVHG